RLKLRAAQERQLSRWLWPLTAVYKCGDPDARRNRAALISALPPPHRSLQELLILTARGLALASRGSRIGVGESRATRRRLMAAKRQAHNSPRPAKRPTPWIT